MIKLKDLMGESTNIDSTNDHVESPNAWWISTPGSPYRMTNQIASMALIPNMARQALKSWLAYVKPAWKQYGSPEKWPNEVRQKAEALGGEFAKALGSSLPPTDNAPREPGPPSGMWA